MFFFLCFFVSFFSPLLQLLKTLGANEHLEVPSSGFTALTFAARQGHIEIVRFLHRLDTSLGSILVHQNIRIHPSFLLGEGWSGTGLMWAAAVGETSLVKSLLAKGARVSLLFCLVFHSCPHAGGPVDDRDDHGFDKCKELTKFCNNIFIPVLRPPCGLRKTGRLRPLISCTATAPVSRRVRIFTALWSIVNTRIHTNW